MEAHIQATTVRNHLHRVAKRVEAELGEEQFSFIDTCKRDLASLPKPSTPITVGIDGGYVRKWDDKKTHFEVIVGKSILEDGTNKCCGFIQYLENLEIELDISADENVTTRKLLRAVEEFHTYITNNENFITNYAERYRQGDRISSGFVESAVNYVIAKRFTKRQQMKWSPEGAHLLLQTRTCVLNGDLEQTFRKWHPKFRASND